jgi:hypothetical protein
MVVTAHKSGAILPGAASPLTAALGQNVGDDHLSDRNKIQL